MRRFLLFFALMLLTCSAYAQVDLDSRPTDGAVDAYYGGLGLGPSEASGVTWTQGDIPFCYESTGPAAGEFRPVGSGVTRYMTFDGVYVKMGDSRPFCWGTDTDVCSAFNPATSRLEVTTSGAGNPVYFEDGIATGASTTPGADFDVSTDTGTVEGAIKILCSAANDCYIEFKVDPGSDTEATRLRVDKNGITVTGTVSGGVNVQTKSINYTILASEAYNTNFINTGASTRSFTLPAAAAGMNVCVLNGQGITQILSLYPASGDYIVYNGVRTTITTGYVSATASSSNYACVFAADDTDWYMMDRNGSWTRY